MIKYFPAKLILIAISSFVIIILIRRNIEERHRFLDNIYKPIHVLVADNFIKKDSIILFKDLSKISFPRNYLPKGYVPISKIDSIEGKQAAKNFYPGEFLDERYLIDPSSKKKTYDKRYFPVDRSLLNVPYVTQNQLLDVLISYEDSKGASHTKTVLQNIELIRGTDSSLPSLGDNLMLSMTPLEAEIFAHSRQKGKLSFVLRNPLDRLKKRIPSVNDSNFTRGKDYILGKTITSNIEIIAFSF